MEPDNLEYAGRPSAAGSSSHAGPRFLGLEDQFGQGCDTVLIGDPDLIEELNAAMESAWQSSQEVWLPLQRAAARQIEFSWSAYERVRDLLDARRGQNPRSRYRG